MFLADHLLRLESDMRTVHPLLLGTPENVASSQICSLLQQLGVKKLTPSEVIQHHILPSLKSQDAEVIKININRVCLFVCFSLF